MALIVNTNQNLHNACVKTGYNVCIEQLQEEATQEATPLQLQVEANPAEKIHPARAHSNGTALFHDFFPATARWEIMHISSYYICVGSGFGASARMCLCAA